MSKMLPHGDNAYPAPRRGPRSTTKKSATSRKSSGCGCLGLTTIAVVAIIGVVGALSAFLGPVTPSFTKKPIPENVPPAVAAAPPMIDINVPGRTSDLFTEWAEPIAVATGIPAPALRAYANAQLIAAAQHPTCNLSWNTLAGLGQVETRHGTYTGDWLKPARIEEDGVARPHIVGVPLDGSPGLAEIRDTDGGQLDGDTVYDRAVGPLQFIPETWSHYGVDASGDGIADPHHIDDAAASAANLLCAGERDLATPEGWTDAIRSYNQSGKYVRDVRDAAANYALNQPA